MGEWGCVCVYVFDGVCEGVKMGVWVWVDMCMGVGYVYMCLMVCVGV